MQNSRSLRSRTMVQLAQMTSESPKNLQEETNTVEAIPDDNLTSHHTIIAQPSTSKNCFSSHSDHQNDSEVSPQILDLITPEDIGIDTGKKVEFWYSNGDVLVVSVGDDYALKFWDLQNKIEIATNGFFARSICSGECRHFCIGDMGGILTSYERVGNHISPGPTLNLELRDNYQLIAHTVDGKYLTAMAWDKRGTVQFLCEGVIEGEKLIEFEIVQEKDWIRLPKNLAASIQRLTIFGIGENCIGSTNYYAHKWCEYNLGQHFGCNVKSIALHAQILMFGLEDGSIHLLYIPHYGHVRELEKRIKHSKKIEVDTEPIVDLTVLEVDKKPCIVAVTDQKVHLINFF